MSRPRATHLLRYPSDEWVPLNDEVDTMCGRVARRHIVYPLFGWDVTECRTCIRLGRRELHRRAAEDAAS